MTTTTLLPATELAHLLTSWEVHLRAERKSENTIRTYLKGATAYVNWCVDKGDDVDPLDRKILDRWVTGLLASGNEPGTAKVRLMGVRHFTRWLAEEGEIESNPFANVKPPKVDLPVVPVMSDEQLRALIAACQPPTSERAGIASLRHRRDEAIVRIMVETGIRAAECVGIKVDDVDLAERVIVVMGKGGRGRRVSFGPEAARALDRYLRVRRLHKRSDDPALWLGARGKGLAYGGLYAALTGRAEAAGIEGLHPHVLRHTSADRWLARGGTEVGLMASHGWNSTQMITRYGRANRERRSIEEARRLNLGDLTG